MKKVILWMLLMGMIITARAQNNKACMELVKAAMKTMKETAKRPAGNKAYYCHYTFKTVMEDSIKKPNTISDVRMKVDASHMHYISKEMEMYEDKDVLISVLPQRKLISKSNPARQAEKEKLMGNAAIVNDSLLGHCKIIQCTEVSGGKLVILKVEEQTARISKIESIRLLVNADKTLKEVALTYVPHSQVRRIELSYNEMNTDYKGKEFQKPATAIVFDASGKLLPQYNGYRVFDRTQPTNNHGKQK